MGWGRSKARRRSSSGSRSPDSRDSSPEPTKKCKHCSRSFAESRLSKHEKICKKTTKRPTKTFDSSKQRTKGSDTQKARRDSVGPPRTKWRERHNEFQSAVKSAKGGGGGGGGRARTPTGYVECEFCGRKFNEKAADRHIPFCKSKNEKENSDSRHRGSRGGASRDRGGGGRSNSRDKRSGSRSDDRKSRGGGSKSRGDSRNRSDNRRSNSRSKRR